LTKEPVEFVVPSGRVRVEASMSRLDLEYTAEGWRRIVSWWIWRSPVSTHVAYVGQNDVLRLSFHKVFFMNHIVRGHFRRE